MSNDEIAACDKSFASFMERFGYPSPQRPPRSSCRGVELFFGTTGNSDGYLREGWSHPESSFTWTLGGESRLQFPKPVSARSYVLEMRVRPFAVTEQLPSQRIAVAVNDVPVGTATVERPTMLRFPIPWTVLAAHATTNVIFSLPDAAQPRELREGHDRRRLAFAFEKLVFRGDSASVAAPAPAIAETNGVLP